MKFTYACKTPDGARHECSMDAEKREPVFETLRARGIIAVFAVAGVAANPGTAETFKTWRLAHLHYLPQRPPWSQQLQQPRQSRRLCHSFA